MAFSTAKTRSRNLALIVGWSHQPHLPSTSALAMAYGFSVFWIPLSRSIGLTKSVACPEGSGILNALFTTSCDWTQAELGWMYTLFFVLLGSSAAIWGGWLERAGPRKAGLVSAVCWCGGLLISAYGVYSHQLWLMWLGSGVIGRDRPGAWLHLSGFNPCKMVPRPARHGDRHGNHGLRWRSHDRLSAGNDFNERRRSASRPWPGDRPPKLDPQAAGIQDGNRSRRLANLRRHGGHLLRVHGLGRPRVPRAAGWLETGWLDAPRESRCDDHERPRPPQRRSQNTAVLADLGGPLPQRLGWHRHHRRSLAHAARDLRRLFNR